MTQDQNMFKDSKASMFHSPLRQGNGHSLGVEAKGRGADGK